MNNFKKKKSMGSTVDLATYANNLKVKIPTIPKLDGNSTRNDKKDVLAMI